MTDVRAEAPKGLRVFGAAFASRKSAIMLAFGFAAGLPYTLLIGTLNAWLGASEVNLATIGLLSWIGLAYAFKFLWSPVVDRLNLPVLGHLGRRRGWLLLCQVVLAAAFLVISGVDPRLEIGTFAIVAVVAAFASATQDVVIDAWRIDVADERTGVEVLSAVYQLGFRTAALVGGALALVLSERIGWPMVYAVMAGAMALTIFATLLAPDTPRPAAALIETELRQPGAVHPRFRAIGLAIVATGWAWAIWSVASFMARVLGGAAPGETPPSVGDFTKTQGPLIVAATVILPALVAVTLNAMRKRADGRLDVASVANGAGRAADHAYSALILPLAELIGRLRWGVIVALGLILTYRITDNIWGSFAYPFYLQELQYTGDEVAFASKIFGVFMTMAGIALGGILFATLGRMPTLFIGAVTAAASNLLYADLAAGAPGIDAFARLFGFGGDLRMTRLLIAVSGENIAGGLAGAAFVAYLSGITSKAHSAVQFALLSSLTFLVGSLGRAAIGERIEAIGYAPVFNFCAALGLIAVGFVLLEWVRDSWERRRAAGATMVQGADAPRLAVGDAA